jgi:hypothetical protein
VSALVFNLLPFFGGFFIVQIALKLCLKKGSFSYRSIPPFFVFLLIFFAIYFWGFSSLGVSKGSLQFWDFALIFAVMHTVIFSVFIWGIKRKS